jgi:hypothetical protein
MRAQRLKSRNFTLVLAILMITTGLNALVTTTPASATNPVGSIKFENNGSLKYGAGAPGSQNTTIEFWMKQTSTGGIQRIFTTSWSFGSNNITIRTNGSTCLIASVANIELVQTSGTNYTCPTVNVWHHIALVGLGTTWNLYVDGILARTSSWSDATKPNITDTDAFIGGWEGSERFNGHVSNFRYVIGTAVYTSNFSSPAAPLAATQSAGSAGINAITSGTTVLLNTRYDSTLSTARVDTSGNTRTPTTYGTPVASSDSPPISVACSSGGSFSILNNVVISSTLDCAGAVVIPEGVTSIADNAFSRLSKTTLEQSRITSVTISNSVTSIGNTAFTWNTHNSSLTIGSGLTTIGSGAFYNNLALRTLVFPSNVRTINSSAFQNIPLTSLTFNEGLTTIGPNTFAGTNFKKLVIPNSVTTIGNAAFAINQIEDLLIGTGVTALPNRVFDNSSKLQYLTIPSGITSLGTDVFKSYSKSTYIYCGTSLSSATLNTAGLTSSTKVCPAVPGPPTIETATLASDTSATVTFTAPQHSGGSVITSYTAVSSPDSIAASVNQSGSGSITVTGLSRGVSYTFAVYASNIGGAGASSVASATVRTPDAPPTITSATISGSPIYGQTLTAIAAGVTGNPTSTAYQWKRNGSDISGANNATYQLGSSDLSAQISVTITVTNSEGSASVTSDSTAGVGKATPTFDPWSDVSKIYGASSFSLTAPIASTAGTWSYSSANPSVVSINENTASILGFGTSVISAMFTPADPINFISNQTVTMTISVAKATTSLSLALAAATPTYGAVDTITATASVPGAVTFKSSGTNIPGCENVATSGSSPITAQCPWIPGGVASYSLTAVLTPTNTIDFSGVTASALAPTSVQAAITVTPDAGQSKVYLGNNPTLTYSITSGALFGSDVLTGALTYTGSIAGDYAIGIGTLSNSNYIITLAPVTFAITKATQTAVSLSSLSSVYNPSNQTVSLTGSGGAGTGDYTYALDSSNTTPGCSVSGSTLTYTTAGTCVVAVTRTSDTNYLSRTDIVSFSIGLATQTITFGSLSAKNYSSDTFTVSATSSASLTVVFTSASQSVCTTSGISGSTITLLSVGTCVINANQIGDASISAAETVSQNFIVNPRAITVTADAKTKAYGVTDPTLTYTITTGSLVLGDVITGSLTRAAGTGVGTYQIQQGTLTTANNPKYAITFVAADLSITRATPALVLTYPNSNVAILRPGAVDTPTVTTSSSSGALTFATSAASSICTVDTTTGVISLFGAGSCPVGMTTAQTTNFIQHTETITVTVALLSTSLVGIDPGDLVSMGQPFFAHASVDQAYSFSSGNNGASVAIPAGALDPLVPISIHLLTDSADQRAMIGGTGTSVLSVVVSWVAPDGSVPNTNAGKAISVTLTNSAIKKDAKVYSIIGNQSRLLGTATADGSVTTLITEDPVLLVINPVVTTPTPVTSDSSRGTSYVMSVAIDNSAAISVANDKLAADKAAAELKASQEKAAAIAAEAAALKAAKDLADAQEQAAAELKAAQEKAAEELRIAEDLRLAKLTAEAELKAAAEKKAALDAAAATVKPTVTLYSLSPTLKLNAYDSAYLNKYAKSLKNGAPVTCIGYSYTKNTTVMKANALAKSQATAVCALMKKTNKTLKTSVVVYPATKAPKAATGAKWVGVSYRIDGFRN